MERLQSPASGGGEFGTEPSPAARFWAREAEALAGAAVERRRQSPVRFFILSIVATVTATSLNIPGLREWLWSWTVGNLAVQSLEIAILWRFRPGRAPVDAASVTIGLLATSAVSLAFDLGALILWRTPGMLGPAAALLLVTAGLMNVTAISRGSALAFGAAAAPHVVLLLFGPVIASGAILHDPMFPVLAGASFVLCVAMVTVWRRGERLSRTQVEARALADRRRAEAEAATEAKSRYAAAVSHELRTPLTAILAVAAETERHARSEWGRQNAQLVGDAGRMMRRLLDDLLDLAKIEAGHMGVEALAFSPRALLEDVRRFWAAEAAAAHIDLVLDGAEAVPVRASGDPTRLRQVLNNLISNAVKFTPNGTVRLIASTSAVPGGGLRLTVDVVDTGRGRAGGRDRTAVHPFPSSPRALR